MNWLLANWKTGALGLVGILSGLAMVFPSVKPYAEMAGTIAAGLGLTLAKDGNITGGTKPQTAEAAVRVEEAK